MKPDTAYINSLQRSGDYKYLEDLYDNEQEELVEAMEEVSDYSGEASHSVLENIAQFFEDNQTVIAYIALAAVIIVIAWLVIRMLRRLQPGEEAEKPMGEDTIYGHHWRKEVDAAMAASDYGAAVILCYLYRLEQLHDSGIIKFSAHKTPGMFLDEIADFIANPKPHDAVGQTQPQDSAEGRETASAPALAADMGLLETTRELTINYLRVRYGHKPVAKDTALKLRSIAGI